ncbi:MAG TPA: ATP-binding protein [Dehalococcoidia bacterium]|nr:ATP-binding protein [Dehalococcoidia bacterium]
MNPRAASPLELGVAPQTGSDPELQRWRLLNAITDLLKTSSRQQPLLLVLEDLHWADRGTLDLLLHVARNLTGSRQLIVGTLSRRGGRQSPPTGGSTGGAETGRQLPGHPPARPRPR